MTGAERKRAWRAKPGNKAAENKLRQKQAGRVESTRPRRATEEGRLDESIRDTLRKIDRKLER